jgi:hypothetical protein
MQHFAFALEKKVSAAGENAERGRAEWNRGETIPATNGDVRVQQISEELP